MFGREYKMVARAASFRTSECEYNGYSARFLNRRADFLQDPPSRALGFRVPMSRRNALARSGSKNSSIDSSITG